MEQNKMGKYLKYAIGEILLVVIGILIALQINNWNEDRKLEAKTHTYYQQLLEDLNKDKVFSKTTIDKFQRQREAYQNYLIKFSNSKLTVNDMYQELRKLNLESYALNFNTNTIETLQNSGEIVLIPSVLRNRLLDLKRRQQKISLDESLDNRGKTGIAERVSLLIGSMTLDDRLKNQKDLKTDLSIDKNINDIIIGLEAIQDWMEFSEKKSIRLLKELLTEIESVEKLIKEKVEVDD
ncbi:MAG: hypothetical protein KJO49_06670 [Bacteroidia bacterium]|nr:hypothetical protein [Bacteroidia bacterium]NNL79918.1 hypothetical protein [Flavobacteriaceae bacterium]